MKKFILTLLAVSAITGATNAQTAFAMLRGVSAGIYVPESDGTAGADLTPVIRGLNSIRTINTPLWIVDGVEIVGDLGYLNPFDVKSIEVIKDISALSEYGSRGANGVIIVTTGRKGAKDFNGFWDSGISVGNRFSHIHSLALEGKTGKAKYGISAWYNSLAGAETTNTSTRGGIMTRLETDVNKVVSFGTKTDVSLGNATYPVYNPGDEDENVFRRVTNSTWLKFTPVKNLDIKLSLAIDYSNRNEFLWSDAGRGSAEIMANNLFRITPKIYVNWFRYIADDHLVKLGAGFDATCDIPKYGNMAGNSFFTKKLKARGIEFAESSPSINKSYYSYSNQGGFFKAGYEYRKIFGLSATARLDRAPRYDTKPRFFKSIEGYFDVRNLAFPKSDAVSAFRLRSGWGDAGKDIRSYYPVTVESGLEPFYEGLFRNRTTEFNVGADLGFMSNRIALGIAYYDRLSSDGHLGFDFGKKTSHYYELASTPEKTYDIRSIIANKGFEGNLCVDVIRSGKFNWRISADATWNRNIVVSVDPLDAGYAVLGYPADIFFEIKKDITGDGMVNTYDLEPSGHLFPNIYGDLATMLSYGPFEFEARANFLSGSSVIDDHIRFSRASLAYNLKSITLRAGYANVLAKSFVAGFSFRF